MTLLMNYSMFLKVYIWMNKTEMKFYDKSRSVDEIEMQE